MKKMLFTLSNILLLGIPYLIVRMMGGLTPDEKEATFDKIKRYTGSLRLKPFAVEGDYKSGMELLFPDLGDRDSADHFLVHTQRRYHFRASDRQRSVIEKLPDRTFDADFNENDMVEVIFGQASYNSFDHLFCHECRTPMMRYMTWEGATCGNCSSHNVTEFGDLGEREYVSLLKVYDKGYQPTVKESPTYDSLVKPKTMRNDF